MIIRSKQHVEEFCQTFADFATFDFIGNKHYFVLEDKEKDGQYTLMKYPNHTWSIHGVGETYCDDSETFLSDEEVRKFIYKNRSAIHHALKSKMTV